MDFEELIYRLAPVLKAITYKLDGKYASFDRDDLYQEAVFYLWNKFREGELENKTTSFILKGCYYFLKNYIRIGYKRIDKGSFSISATYNGGQDCNLKDIIPRVERNDVLNKIDTNILIEDIRRFLTHREKKVFTLSIQGYSLREISKNLGVSHVAIIKVMKRIRRKCQDLKKELIGA